MTEIVTGFDDLKTMYYFPSAVYQSMRPDFIPLANELCDEYLKKTGHKSKCGDIYPADMSLGFQDYPRAAPIADYIKKTAGGILESQGFNMSFFNMRLHELWCQEHHKYSNQEEHIHGFGTQITGFYFVNCPKGGSQPMIHDPRPAKKFANLPEKNMSQATYASTMIGFRPEPGMFVFTNSWLPHSFTRNAADEPSRFIHFNLSLMPAKQVQEAPATEIV